MKTNIFLGVTSLPVEMSTLKSIIYAIKTDVYKDMILEYRDVLLNNPEKADAYKKCLTAFTPAGTFNQQRNASNLANYSGMVHLDYDKIDSNTLNAIRQKLQEDNHTYGYFVSPSGNGLKVFIATNATREEHKDAFNEIRNYFDNYLGIESDSSVSDLARLCFVSYDPDAYLNENYLVYSIQNTAEQLLLNSLDGKSIWEFTSRKLLFTKGARNNFVYRFAHNSNRQGLPLNEALSYAHNYSTPDFSSQEIDMTIKAVYQKSPQDYGSLAISAVSSIATRQNDLDYTFEDAKWDSSPLISDDIYARLPNIIQESCKIFSGRERDVVLTGLLTVLGAALSNSWGLYDRKRLNPNLYSFVIAPAASGKGSMKHAKDVVECYHQKIKEDKYSKSQKVFFIPANISASKFISHLLINQGQGLIFEIGRAHV